MHSRGGEQTPGAESAGHMMATAEKNERVRFLRGLAAEKNRERTAAAILLGLNDRERRVREVAIKGAVFCLHSQKVVARLAAMVRDRSEKRKLRALALNALCGKAGQNQIDTLPPPAADALAALIEDHSLRPRILLSLARLDLTPAVEALLSSFVERGNIEEQALAQRALAGERVVNLGSFSAKERAEIRAQADLAAGRVFYWIERDRMTEPRPKHQ